MIKGSLLNMSSHENISELDVVFIMSASCIAVIKVKGSLHAMQIHVNCEVHCIFKMVFEVVQQWLIIF